VTVARRPATGEDEDFIAEVFMATRSVALGLEGLPTAQVRQLLAMQRQAQVRDYGERYPAADLEIVLSGERPVGYLRVDRSGEPWVLVDVALLPTAAGQGTGTRLLDALIREARAVPVAIAAQVAHGNPALRLYRRLGFEVEADDGVYYEILRRHDPGGQA
jgi:ribosomal protein S18 acetylase RimI-like enzyme